MNIGIGTQVSYSDMANPLREGVIVGETAGQWAVIWIGYDQPTLAQDGLNFHTTVTPHMLENAIKRQRAFRAASGSSARCAGWAVAS